MTQPIMNILELLAQGRTEVFESEDSDANQEAELSEAEMLAQVMAFRPIYPDIRPEPRPWEVKTLRRAPERKKPPEVTSDMSEDTGSSFSIHNIPRAPVVYTEDDMLWDDSNDLVWDDSNDLVWDD